jgi:hypothetical protein
VRETRRTLLRRGGPFVGVGLAGCTSGLPGDGPPGGTAGLPRRLRLERASCPASGGESVDPIAFEDLPETEREIVRTALEEGEYVVDPDQGSPAFESLRDRIEERTGDGETLRVYLRHGETYSSVWKSLLTDGGTVPVRSVSSVPNATILPGRVRRRRSHHHSPRPVVSGAGPAGRGQRARIRRFRGVRERSGTVRNGPERSGDVPSSR